LTRRKFVNVDLVDLSQKPEAETAPDHRGGREHPLFSLVESLEPASDDQGARFPVRRFRRS